MIGYVTEARALEAAQHVITRDEWRLHEVFECVTCITQARNVETLERFVEKARLTRRRQDMREATTRTTTQRAPQPRTVLAPQPNAPTSAWTDLKNLEQRITEAHELLSTLENTLVSVLSPVQPEGDAAVSAPGALAVSTLTDEARKMSNAVDELCTRLTRLRMRVEL